MAVKKIRGSVPPIPRKVQGAKSKEATANAVLDANMARYSQDPAKGGLESDWGRDSEHFRPFSEYGPGAEHDPKAGVKASVATPIPDKI